MALTQINFDGIVGPSHNYAGLSLGNVAATSHKGNMSYPRAAALQGLAKMRHNLQLGLKQGFFVPLARPDCSFLAAMGLGNNAETLVDRSGAERALVAAAWSASAMWTANAATVSPAPDTADRRCHLTVANLITMPHRAVEWRDTLRQLELAFGNRDHFAVHAPIPPSFGDEGAANHMRMATYHASAGIEIFVYGRQGGRFPARQHEQASRAVARLHRLDPARTLFVEQQPAAIEAGAFHNDVVAVANGDVLFCHEQAFVQAEELYAAIRRLLPGAHIITVPAASISLADAVASYLFNAQLVTLPAGGMALIVPDEAWQSPNVRRWLDDMLATNGPIRQVLPVDVRQSMANGGGPACLRLRVECDPVHVDARFLLDESKADQMEAVIARTWPEQIAPDQIGTQALHNSVVSARRELLTALDLDELA
ncbi:N-succinylarginine dihydrolase [Croceicoccus sp. F390]|uniref:N-succinylarginine dihydrolase n=1 Tax=Croceicoccus esteveae TaxID=3075597 RepID=A0ABU2ZH46_9SPHN|nr:N-succinylarginine dihydrolase [Croceicoccus sp. F390]MDT0575388.1 N-succinylarginine dihydrolase [Croceicoccus sp. F390]